MKFKIIIIKNKRNIHKQNGKIYLFVYLLIIHYLDSNSIHKLSALHKNSMDRGRERLKGLS